MNLWSLLLIVWGGIWAIAVANGLRYGRADYAASPAYVPKGPPDQFLIDAQHEVDAMLPETERIGIYPRVASTETSLGGLVFIDDSRPSATLSPGPGRTVQS